MGENGVQRGRPSGMRRPIGGKGVAPPGLQISFKNLFTQKYHQRYKNVRRMEYESGKEDRDGVAEIDLESHTPCHLLLAGGGGFN